LKALRRNAMRTALTMLGVIIGVSAVICTVAIGDGASDEDPGGHRERRRQRRLGRSRRRQPRRRADRLGSTKTLTLADMRAIREQVPLIAHARHGRYARAARLRQPELELDGPRRLAGIPAVKAWPIVKGGMFDETDVERAAPACVLGQTVVDQLFGEQEPLGETVRVAGEPCRVVGVLGIKGQSATGQDQDDTFFMPYTTVMKKIKGQYWLDDIMMSAVRRR
jgi:putative ABC transport system permease protein